MATTTQTTKQLTVNITVTNTWTQLIELGGAAYTVGAGARADVRWLRAINFGANSADVEFAVSPTSTITNEERLMPPVPLTTNEQMQDDSGLVMPTGYALWARATGTTPNVTFMASLLELTVV